MTLYTLKLDKHDKPYLDVSSLFERDSQPRRTFRNALLNKLEYLLQKSREKGKQYGYFRAIDLITDYNVDLFEIEKRFDRELALLQRHINDMVSNVRDTSLTEGYRYYEDAIGALRNAKNLIMDLKERERNFFTIKSPHGIYHR